MNLDCKPATCSVASDFEKESLLRSIQDYPDMEYYTPCQTAPLLASGLIARVEAPFGGYYFQLTKVGELYLERINK